MRVCVVTFGSDAGKSGISQYIRGLFRALPAAAPDIEFDVMLHEGEKEIYIANGGLNAILKSGAIENTFLNLAWHQVGLPWICARDRYDVLFLPSGRRLPYWTPCPRVATIHDMAPLHVQEKYDRLHMFYNLRVMPLIIRRLSWVLTVSECSKRDLIEYAHVNADRIAVVPNAVDADRYYPRDKQAAGERVAQRYGVRLPYILYIARIEHPGKNHVRLIQAFERLKTAEDLPHQLVLVGSDWSRVDEVHRVAEGCRFRNDIVFTGFASTEDLPDLYSGAEAFVFPSLFEGFGIPVLEAMASGVPVACSNTSSLPEVAGDAGVLFNPNDVESIEGAMRRILTDQGLRDRCARRGIERAKGFTWKNTAERTVQVLRRAAEARG